MGIESFVEKAAGVIAAEKALESVDPGAGLIAKTAAAVAGYEGVGAIKEHFEEAAKAKAQASETTSAPTPDEDPEQSGQ